MQYGLTKDRYSIINDSIYPRDALSIWRIIKSTIVLLLFYKTVILWFLCLHGLVQTLNNLAPVKKGVQNHSLLARISRAFLRACSYGETLSLLARKHFDLPNSFVLFIWDGFPAKRESID